MSTPPDPVLTGFGILLLGIGSAAAYKLYRTVQKLRASLNETESLTSGKTARVTGKATTESDKVTSPVTSEPAIVTGVKVETPSKESGWNRVAEYTRSTSFTVRHQGQDIEVDAEDLSYLNLAGSDSATTTKSLTGDSETLPELWDEVIRPEDGETLRYTEIRHDTGELTVFGEVEEAGPNSRATHRIQIEDETFDRISDSTDLNLGTEFAIELFQYGTLTPVALGASYLTLIGV